jgi:hypothetical protein
MCMVLACRRGSRAPRQSVEHESEVDAAEDRLPELVWQAQHGLCKASPREQDARAGTLRRPTGLARRRAYRSPADAGRQPAPPRPFSTAEALLLYLAATAPRRAVVQSEAEAAARYTTASELRRRGVDLFAAAPRRDERGECARVLRSSARRARPGPRVEAGARGSCRDAHLDLEPARGGVCPLHSSARASRRLLSDCARQCMLVPRRASSATASARRMWPGTRRAAGSIANGTTPRLSQYQHSKEKPQP